MEKTFTKLRNLRKFILTTVEGLTEQPLNEVPDGFSNNIIWQLAHLVAAQQNLCYRRSGLPAVVDEALVTTYLPGTKPEVYIDQNEIENIKTLLLTTLDKLETDYNDGIFKQYPAFTTRYGVEVASIEDAIEFLSFHDGYHMGYVMALRGLYDFSQIID